MAHFRAGWILRDAKEKEVPPLEKMLLAGDVSFLSGSAETREATIERLAARVAELEQRLGGDKH